MKYFFNFITIRFPRRMAIPVCTPNGPWYRMTTCMVYGLQEIIP
jgi:hypothetical protein